MKKRATCPLCGMMIWESQVHKFYNIDIYEQERYVRAKGSGGFRYTESKDQGFVDLIRAKIKALYERFFEPEPSITLVPGVDLLRATKLGSRLRLKAPTLKTPTLALNRSVLLKPGVKIVG